MAIKEVKSGNTFKEAMNTVVTGLNASVGNEQFSSAGERPVPNAKSDHGPRQFYDLDHHFPIPPPNQK